MISPPAAASPRTGGTPVFRHELYPYRGEAAFLQGAVTFIHDALDADETVLVAVGEDKRAVLRDAVGAGAGRERVTFMDTGALGRNPGRLIPAWKDWIAKSFGHGLPVRGISESPWATATPAERGELRYHEWLVNRTFIDSPAWWLLCPYDTAVVEETVLDSARRCHPYHLVEGVHGDNPHFADGPFPFDELTAPRDPEQSLVYGAGDLGEVRARVAACARRHGLTGPRLQEFLVAATEVAANSVRHGGGRGTLRAWVSDDALICQFDDSGHIRDPLVGRYRPTPQQIGGRGLWLVNQLCDLVQIRSTAERGTTVRLSTALS
ncbi:anti-sigma factor RsbA family regulatory protein [Actinacidiphila paucisporea]|uniref:Anti-sigma regulatory factor (Ser/Thr protein kinase) n=1 Tax=Actinacidiphila paucisporea TaxID=310782 RepID=A0A1M7M6B7_9ACTN|nr:anti-sigma factor RsbA family regulatory protein [Actinacidiphila paucisporea]SHM86277.1 Anti-sigma regulatory factor (Ser/Thr protein kinase) [Actinacidiphila paucisporea]